ncbi:hypothetical protein [Phocaeicola sp.]
MHYSQGRDRWFGRIQSAPTVGGNVIYRLSLTAMGLNPPESSVTTLGVMHTVNVIGRKHSAPTVDGNLKISRK